VIKVITYGTYDMLHYGHIRLLERAKALGDYLIVGVTSDTYDQMRGKINVQQSLTERIEAIKSCGLADEIIIEEYEGQKIEDIKRYDVDIFAIGSDWKGKFDYLNEYCKVVYLERTNGVSSSQLRAEERKLSIGIVGNSFNVMSKFITESSYVNGIEMRGVCTQKKEGLPQGLNKLSIVTNDFDELLNEVDAIYLVTHPTEHYIQIKNALLKGKHMLCESPLAVERKECKELFELARQNHCILMESIKTAYALAFNRLNLLVKTGTIGDVVSVDATCTSLRNIAANSESGIKKWGSLHSWGPYALLAVFSILGVDYLNKSIQTRVLADDYDLFTKINFIYEKAVASIKVGNGVKSEGELIISGTKGYIYVPAPWWKTDYFEVRYENPQENKRYFYQLEGEGIRYMMVSFLKSVKKGKPETYIPENITYAISGIMEDYSNKLDTTTI